MRLGPAHRFVDAGQAEAAFLHDLGVAGVGLDDGRVEVSAAEALVLGRVVGDDVEVNDGQTQGEAHLGRGEAHAV